MKNKTFDKYKERYLCVNLETGEHTRSDILCKHTIPGTDKVVTTQTHLPLARDFSKIPHIIVDTMVKSYTLRELKKMYIIYTSPYMVVDNANRKKAEYFHTLEEIRVRYNVRKGARSTEDVRASLSKMKLRLVNKLSRQTNQIYQVINLDTCKVILMTVNQLVKLTGFTSSTISYRTPGNKLYGKVAGKYLIIGFGRGKASVRDGVLDDIKHIRFNRTNPKIFTGAIMKLNSIGEGIKFGPFLELWLSETFINWDKSTEVTKKEVFNDLNKALCNLSENK